MKEDIILATDGSKRKRVSGRVWVITDSKGDALIVGSNPDFGIIGKTYSHKSKVFDVLSALIFLDEYCDFYFLLLVPNTKFCWDILEIVNKFKTIKKKWNKNKTNQNKTSYDKIYKTADHGAVLSLKKYIPKKMSIYHVWGNVDKRNNEVDLTISARLNIGTDKILETKSWVLIVTNTVNTHITNCSNNECYPKNMDKKFDCIVEMKSQDNF